MLLLRGIQKALFDMALPYGFTLSVWGSGMILTRSRGTPRVGDLFLAVAGVMVAYGALQFFGRRADAPAEEDLGSAERPVLGGALHAGSIGAALGAAALLAEIGSWVAWPLALFASTAIYLLGCGATIAVLARTQG